MDVSLFDSLMALARGWMDVFTMDIYRAVFQLLVLVGIIYVVYDRFIRRSQAEQLLKGVFVTLLSFVIFWGLARSLHFQLLEVVFGESIKIFFIGLIVVFQPELRRTLLFLGQGELFGLQVFARSSKERQAEFLVQELVESARFLHKAKHGALIVLEASNSTTGDYLEVGTPLDSKLSTELILTIFHPSTPLHDGALVINSENRILAAGVLLPLTEDPELSWQYGTRHRAAIGLTEISESSCVVISEETGNISLVREGKLEKMETVDELKKALEKMYHVTVNPNQNNVIALSNRIGDFFEFNRHIQKFFKSSSDTPKSKASGTNKKTDAT